MKIEKSNDLKKIEQFLSSNFSAPTHWPDWNLIVSKYYQTQFYYLAAYEKDEIIGICPVHEVTKGFLKSIHSGQFHFIPNGGWIFNKKVDFQLSNFKASLNKSIAVSSLPLVNEFNIHYSGDRFLLKETLLIDLEKPIDDVWLQDVNSKRRNMIRKAEKSGIVIEIYDQSNIKEFYALYHTANTHYKIGTHSIEFFNDLFNTARNIKFTIWCAKINQQVVGAIVTVNDKNFSLYWLGITVDNVDNYGQGELLQWEAIKQMKINGCKYYDLCYIEKEKLPHIYKFKSGFSSNEVSICSYNKKLTSYKVISKLQRLVG